MKQILTEFEEVRVSAIIIVAYLSYPRWNKKTQTAHTGIVLQRYVVFIFCSRRVRSSTTALPARPRPISRVSGTSVHLARTSVTSCRMCPLKRGWPSLTHKPGQNYVVVFKDGTPQPSPFQCWNTGCTANLPNFPAYLFHTRLRYQASFQRGRDPAPGYQTATNEI